MALVQEPHLGVRGSPVGIPKALGCHYFAAIFTKGSKLLLCPECSGGTLLCVNFTWVGVGKSMWQVSSVTLPSIMFQWSERDYLGTGKVVTFSSAWMPMLIALCGVHRTPTLGDIWLKSSSLFMILKFATKALHPPLLAEVQVQLLTLPCAIGIFWIALVGGRLTPGISCLTIEGLLFGWIWSIQLTLMAGPSKRLTRGSFLH